MLEIIERLENRLKEIDQQLVDTASSNDRKGLIELNRERRRIENTLETGRKYRKYKETIDEARQIISSGEDADLVALAREELAECEPEFEKLETELKLKLLPRDPDDDKAAIVEIRAGTGGAEAGLFAGVLYKMYHHFAYAKGRQVEQSSPGAPAAGAAPRRPVDRSLHRRSDVHCAWWVVRACHR